MSVINTNVKSLVAQQALSINGRNLATAMERLSTGQKINSAKDDAAGLAISTRMTAQVRGLNMAIKNANDGMSLLQTAEGAMNEITNMVQRMRELAVQAATDTVSVSDRAALNDEVVALQKEINRIAGTTQFNGFNILDGSFKEKVLQIGDKAGQTMGVSLESVEASSLGAGMPISKGVVVSGRVDAATLSGDGILINGTNIGFDSTGLNSDPVTGVTDLKDVVAAINAADVGVKATAYNEVVARYKGTGVSAAQDIVITVTGLDTGEETVITLGATNSMQDVVNQINAQGGASTVLARLTDDGYLALYNDSGATIEVVDGSAEIDDVNGLQINATGINGADESLTYYGFLKLASTNGSPFTLQYETAADADALGINEMMADGTVVASDVLDASGFDQSTWIPGSLTINGVDIWAPDLDITGANLTATAGTERDPEDEFVRAINRFTGETGVTAGLTSDGRLTLSSINGGPIQIRVGEDFKQGAAAGANTDTLFLLDQNVGSVDLAHAKASLGSFGGGASVAAANVLTQSTAVKAIEIMDGALEQVSRYRSGIGAQVNRLTSTVDNLANVVTNTEASRSRILDTDYASETTKLAKAQIIQQAATAMLAQANQQPQTVLALLQ